MELPSGERILEGPVVEWALNGAVSTEDGVKSNEKSGKKIALTVV